MTASARRVAEVAANLAQPHDVFRPQQVLRRIRFELTTQRDGHETRLPWEPTISYSSTETVGRALARRGIYDVAVSETLLQLADPGETAADRGLDARPAEIPLTWGSSSGR